MIRSTTTGNVGQAVESTLLDGISGLPSAPLDHELDYFHVDGGSKNRL